MTSLEEQALRRFPVLARWTLDEGFSLLPASAQLALLPAVGRRPELDRIRYPRVWPLGDQLRVWPAERPPVAR